MPVGTRRQALGSSVSGPSSLDVGERGTWTVNVRGGRTDYLTFSVDWDDDDYNPYYPYAQTDTFFQTNRVSHTYYDEGTYRIRFTASDGGGDFDTATKTVRVEDDNDDDNDEEHISIDDMDFHPDVLRVDRGTRVAWENDDNIDHMVRSLGFEYFNSGILDPGEDYSHTFNTRGTFAYYCSLHPEMRGTIIVE